MVLSFYEKDGSIDSNSVLISNDEKNIKWGIRVFEEYKNFNEAESLKYGGINLQFEDYGNLRYIFSAKLCVQILLKLYSKDYTMN